MMIRLAGVTDRRTGGHLATAQSALCAAPRGKNKSTFADVMPRPAWHVVVHVGRDGDTHMVMQSTEWAKKTRRAHGTRARLPPTKVFPRLAVNQTILKPRLAATTGGQYRYMGFSRRNKISRCSAYTESEKAIRFRHQDYDPDRAQKFVHVPTSVECRHATFRPNPCTRFLSNLANRQTDRQTNTGKSMYLLLCRR